MKKAALILFSTLMMVSCSGLLWNGDSSDDLTLSINNPFYDGSTGSETRTLSPDGRFLYIELASINDEGVYADDTKKASSGNGTWVETEWGGHAILTYDFSVWRESLKAVFKDIPKDQSLYVRAFLETDETTFSINFDMYGESFPVCYTYDEPGSGPEVWGDFGQVVSVSELNQNLIILSLRLHEEQELVYSPSFDNNIFISDSSIYPSTACQSGSELILGNTSLSKITINLNTATNYLIDAAFSTSVPVDSFITGSSEDEAFTFDRNANAGV